LANIRNDPGAVQAEGVIPLSVPLVSGNEWAYVKECLDTNWVSSAGPFVDRFESMIAEYLGGGHAVAVVNGTAALHLALLIAGVRPNDEVIVPALTFIATANAVHYCGAVPAIVDVDPNYWQLDAEKLETFLSEGCLLQEGCVINKATGRRVAAVVPVHVFGHPADMDAIQAVADRCGLPVVEDAAEALGARYKERAVGRLGPIACLSFNGNKTITSGGGGMIVFEDAALAARARYLSTQAKDDDLRYIHGEIGYNYRLTNILAALGVAQAERLDEFVGRKRAIAARYRHAFADIPGIRLMSEAQWAESGYWLSTVLVEKDEFGIDSSALMAALKERNIQSRPIWQPMHRSPALSHAYRCEIEVADQIHSRALSLPSSVGMTEVQQQVVIDAIRAARR
jgi:perosamine synthetase